MSGTYGSTDPLPSHPRTNGVTNKPGTYGSTDPLPSHPRTNGVTNKPGTYGVTNKLANPVVAPRRD